MSKKNKRVLVVATGRKSKGGINSVIKAYTQTEFWNQWQCYWLESHIDKNKWMKAIYFAKSLVTYIIKLPTYQIVHIHFSEPASAIRKSAYLRLARLFNKKVITHFHSFSTQTTIDGKYQLVYYNLFHSSDQILVLSKSWKQWLSNKWPELENKIEILYNPCLKKARTETSVKNKSILYAGILNDRKGYTDLIKGFAKIVQTNSDWKLILAGDGEIEKGKQLVKDLNIGNNVEFLGWVTGEEKERAFQNSSIFCLPSYAEGFPMAVLDAWAYGLPVITTPVGGIPDVLIDNINGLFIKPGDTEGIAFALEKLIGDEVLQDKLSKESLKLSQTAFGLDNITQQLDCIYSRLVSIK